MTRVRTAGEVLEAIQKVKSGATAFCTNFFPSKPSSKNGSHMESFSAKCKTARPSFCAKTVTSLIYIFALKNPAALEREFQQLPLMATEKLATDLVGAEASLGDLLVLTEKAGFRRYSRLVRLARAASTTPSTAQNPSPVAFAAQTDAPAILGLIEHSFDRFADQLPMLYEIEAAIAAGQISVAKQNGEIAALLFFETQGFTSMVRYWLVADQFQSRGLGSALIRHYFSSQPTVRRFILWVTATNDNAIQKYQHYGYATDGLVDHVLVNEPART